MMMQVVNLPYLLQSLVSSKGAACAQPQSRGTVHHYPAHCSNNGRNNAVSEVVDRSSTMNSCRNTRMGYQCPVESGARIHRGDGAGVVRVKREVISDYTETGSYPSQYCSPCPRDVYHNYRNSTYTVVYPQNTRYCQRVNRTRSAPRTDMSLDIDSLFTQPQGEGLPDPLSPLDLSEQSSLSSYYSANSSLADFSSIYDLPAQMSPEKTAAFDAMGGSCEDICSPVFTKMDPRCELLSLNDLGNSEFAYGGCLNSDVANSLDQDWLVEPVSLPSPEEQDSDIKFSLLSSTASALPQSLPLSLTTQFCMKSSPPPSACAPPSASVTSCMLTPDPSLPPSPASILSYSSEEEEIKNVLASFSDDLDFPTDVQPFSSNQMLQFNTSPQLLDVPTPPSCLMSAPSSPEEDDGEGSFDNYRSFLDQSESSGSRSSSLQSLSPPPIVNTLSSARSKSVSEPLNQSRKRKSLPISSDKRSSAPAPAAKRRMTKASKKERKREQNKTAALRYRQKKKGEKVGIEERRADLEDRNAELKAKVTSLSNEINYLKKLWQEVCERKQCQKSLPL